MYVVCLLFYAIGRFLFLYISYSLFVFFLFRSARKHRSERDVYYLSFQYTLAFYILGPKLLYLPIGLHLSSLSSNGNSALPFSSIGRMWSEARSDEMTEWPKRLSMSARALRATSPPSLAVWRL